MGVLGKAIGLATTNLSGALLCISDKLGSWRIVKFCTLLLPHQEHGVYFHSRTKCFSLREGWCNCLGGPSAVKGLCIALSQDFYLHCFFLKKIQCRCTKGLQVKTRTSSTGLMRSLSSKIILKNPSEVFLMAFASSQSKCLYAQLFKMERHFLGIMSSVSGSRSTSAGNHRP